MNIKLDTAYWITIAHLERWGCKRINDLIIKVYHEQKSNWETFFELNESEWKNIYQLSDNQIRDLTTAKNNLPNNSFLAEELLSQGYEIIPINSRNIQKL